MIVAGLCTALFAASCSSDEDASRSTDDAAGPADDASGEPDATPVRSPPDTRSSESSESSDDGDPDAGDVLDGTDGTDGTDDRPASGAHTVAVCWSSTPTDGRGVEFAEAAADFGLVEPLTGMHPHAVAAGDVDGDGWTDLFVGSFADRPPEDYAVRGASGPSPDRILLGGPEGFTVDDTFVGQRARTSGAVFADLDDDGDLDLVAARNPRGSDDIAAQPTTVFENTGDGWEVRATLGDDVSGRSVAAVDVDRDGIVDLVLGSDRYGDTGTRAYRGTGGFRYEDATDAWGIPDDFTGLAFATVDLDGDGWLDIVMNGDERVLRGGPDGVTVTDVPSLRWELYGDEDDPAGIAVGDLNGDDLPDLVLGQHFNSTVDFGEEVPVRILLNRSGDGTVAFDDVTDESGSPSLWTKSPHVSIVDVDNDGRNDVVTSATAADGLPLVLHNTGTDDGVPQFEPVGEPGDGEYFVTGAATDVDRDGRIDVLQVAWEPERASVLAHNASASGSWLEVDVSDASIGELIAVTDPDSGEAIARAWVEGTTGYAAGAPDSVHLGLGDVTTPVVVRRLVDGEITEHTAPPNARIGTRC